MRAPVVVAYGMGVDSTAMLVGLQQRGERPDLILFADTGDEKPATYAYLPTINAWLASVGFPLVTVVKNARPKSGDVSLSAACIRTEVLPALAYGQHQCSIVWKQVPQQNFVKRWAPAQDAWLAGVDVVTCVGYDAGKQDSCRRYKAEGKAAPGYVNRYPLIEWNWDRAECERQIVAAGLPVPVKSACFHCPASKKAEIAQLAKDSPELLARALKMEAIALAATKLDAVTGTMVKKLKRSKGLGRNFAWGSFVRDSAIQPA
jgi:hypothetical protein